jgi:hypothetical protein
MTERIPFQTFGPSPFKPEAGHYWMLPDELTGKIGKRTMIVLRAILKALSINGPLQTETWANRKEIIDLIPEEQRPKNKRSITGCFSRLVELGVFAKHERIPGTNTWPTKLIMAIRAQFDEPAAAKTDPGTLKAEAAISADKPDNEWCRMTVSYSEAHGWILVPLVEPGKVSREPIVGCDQSEFSSDMRTSIADPIRKRWLWDYLVGMRRRE